MRINSSETPNPPFSGGVRVIEALIPSALTDTDAWECTGGGSAEMALLSVFSM
jgi:hypothetical protein